MTGKPYLVFYATRTALVWATDEEAAFDTFTALLPPRKMCECKSFGCPNHDRSVGRLMPPTRDEVNIRPLAASDQGWIAEFDGPAAREFQQALTAVK